MELSPPPSFPSSISSTTTSNSSSSPSSPTPTANHHQPIQSTQIPVQNDTNQPKPDHLEDLAYDYLSEPNENLVCPICRNPFIDPVMCESTDHIFCRICLIKSLEISPTCPIDRQPLSLSIVSPAPKLIFKLVDELLVSCPLKSKFNCQFVCQRDLMAAHVRSHDLQPHPSTLHPQPSSSSTNLESPQPQHSSSQHSSDPLDVADDVATLNKPSCLLRFQWLSDHAILVDQNDHPQKFSSTSSKSPPGLDPSKVSHSSTSIDLTPCPFERFGCSFAGTPEVIKHHHLSIPSDPSISSDHPRCPFYSIQEILRSFEHLEKRNLELKQQLSQSLVERSELVSGLDSLKSSFRKLWQSHQTNGSDSPLISPSAHVTSPSTRHVSSLFCVVEHSTSSNFIPSLNPTSTDSTQVPSVTSPASRCSDNSLYMNTSRLNYDSLDGHRLKHLDQYPNLLTRSPVYYMSPIASPLASKPKIRVSTFLRKGKVLTRATDTYSGLSPSLESVAAIPSHQSPHPPPPIEGQNTALRHTALPRILTQPSSLSISSTHSAYGLPEPNPSVCQSDTRTDMSSQELDSRSSSLLQKDALSSNPSSHSPTNSLINQKILEIIASLQKSLNVRRFTHIYPPSTPTNDTTQSVRSSDQLNQPNSSRDLLCSSSSQPMTDLGNKIEPASFGCRSADSIDLLNALNKVEKVMGKFLAEQNKTNPTNQNGEELEARWQSCSTNPCVSGTSLGLSVSCPTPTRSPSSDQSSIHSIMTSSSIVDTILPSSSQPKSPSSSSLSSPLTSPFQHLIRPMKL